MRTVIRQLVLAALMPCLGLQVAAGDALESARDAIRRHEYARAAGLLQAPAAAGDAESAFLLAQLLRFGRGVAPDPAEACRLLESAAGADHVRAAASLAAMLDAGECTGSSRPAEDWRRLAVAGGFASAPVKASSEDAVVTGPAPERLRRAARSGEVEEIGRLVASLPVDGTDDYGRTPLLLAAEAGQVDAVSVLLGHGASPGHADRNGDTALLLATRAGNAEIARLLLAAGAPVNASNTDGVTPLMIAARAGDTAMAARLLKAGANPRLRDAVGVRAGDYAARAGHTALAARLGATPIRAPQVGTPAGTLYAGRTPLMIAAERGDLETLSTLITAGDALDAEDGQGMTALAAAAAAGKTQAVETLLAAGAAPDALDHEGWSALGHALRAGHAPVAIALLGGGASARLAQGNGKAPLLLAVESRAAEVIRALIRAGAEIDRTDRAGMTALMAAASIGDVQSVEVLLDAGAWPAMTDARGRTALWHAVNQGQLAAVRRLAVVCPLDVPDSDGTTALAASAARGDEAVLRALLAAGADPTVASGNGNTALHVAAAAGHASSVALLAGRVPTLDAVNRHRDTALILAARSRCGECARTLLAAGASPRLRNSDSLSAADVARLSGNDALAGLLD